MKRPLRSFLIRWVVCGLGLFIAAAILDGKLTFDGSLGVIIVSGLILALVNTFIRPFLKLLSLPIIAITLGLFTIVINGFMVMLASWLYKPLEVSGLWAAMLAGIIIGIVNLLVSLIVEEK